jgi:hypothetical protein
MWHSSTTAELFFWKSDAKSITTNSIYEWITKKKQHFLSITLIYKISLLRHSEHKTAPIMNGTYNLQKWQQRNVNACAPMSFWNRSVMLIWNPLQKFETFLLGFCWRTWRHNICWHAPTVSTSNCATKKRSQLSGSHNLQKPFYWEKTWDTTQKINL